MAPAPGYMAKAVLGARIFKGDRKNILKSRAEKENGIKPNLNGLVIENRSITLICFSSPMHQLQSTE